MTLHAATRRRDPASPRALTRTLRACAALALALLAALSVALPLGGCRRGAQAKQTLLVLRATDARVDTGRPTVYAEIAASAQQRKRGLGGRKSLPDDGGMLFVYARPSPRQFWMQDCHIALDIAFLDAGARILQIDTLGAGAGLPPDEVPRAICEHDVAYVLETRAGWLVEHGIAVGDVVDVEFATVGVRAE